MQQTVEIGNYGDNKPNTDLQGLCTKTCANQNPRCKLIIDECQIQLVHKHEQFQPIFGSRAGLP